VTGTLIVVFYLYFILRFQSFCTLNSAFIDKRAMEN